MKELLQAKSEFRKKGVALKADKQKQGGGGSWKFASEDNFIKTIQDPLSAVGLEYIATLRAMPELSINMVVGTLYHTETGQCIESSKILNDPEPKKDKNGNPLYLDAEIEAGKQFGYWSRILGIRLLGLSDIDPEDVNNVPTDISDGKREELLSHLSKVIDGTKDTEATKAWILKTFKADSIAGMSNEYLTSAINTIEKKQNASA